jgi:hypothetical protein
LEKFGDRFPPMLMKFAANNGLVKKYSAVYEGTGRLVQIARRLERLRGAVSRGLLAPAEGTHVKLSQLEA